MRTLADNPDNCRSSFRQGGFRQTVASFLLQPGLPFAGIPSAERIERIFAKHGNHLNATAPQPKRGLRLKAEG